MIDSIVVGRFVSANALAAVGACAPAYSLILALVSGLTTGAAVIISQNYGTKDDNKVRTAYISSLVLVLLSGALLMVIGTECGMEDQDDIELLQLIGKASIH